MCINLYLNLRKICKNVSYLKRQYVYQFRLFYGFSCCVLTMNFCVWLVSSVHWVVLPRQKHHTWQPNWSLKHFRAFTKINKGENSRNLKRRKEPQAQILAILTMLKTKHWCCEREQYPISWSLSWGREESCNCIQKEWEPRYLWT